MAAVWILNLDAELELAALRRGARYAVSKDVMHAMARAVPAARALMGQDDRELDECLARGDSIEGLQGRAFCPTPSVLERFRSLGVTPEPLPKLEVIEEVNDRGWALRHALAPKDAYFFESLSGLEAFLGERPEAEDWLAKRALGTAGRGQRPLRAQQQNESDRRWISASWPLGGVLLEPRREILAEYSLHGWLDRDGGLRRGQPVVFNTRSRAFASAHRMLPGECLEVEVQALERSLEQTAAALHGAGYFGPFGIDAYAWSMGSGERRFEALSEINARYTLAYALGMAD